jgi:WD40 repeat protein
MKLLGSLVGHQNSRVQYMAMAPDGSRILTGGADETIRFWRVFLGKKRSEDFTRSQLDPFLQLR